MKKIIAIISTVTLLILNSASAEVMGLNFGITGSILDIQADGTETTKTSGEVNSGTANHTLGIASVFVEKKFSNFVVGLDIIPGSADIDSSTRSKTKADYTDDSNTTASKTNSANAEIDNHMMIYGEYHMGNTYLKLGYVDVDINTNESLDTGESYGNTTANGVSVGIGFRNETDRGVVKFEIAYTDYEDISITGTNSNIVDADIDTTALRLSYAF